MISSSRVRWWKASRFSGCLVDFRALAALLFLACAVASPAAAQFSNVSAASFRTPVAPESIVTAFGDNLAATTASAPGAALPTSLAGTTVTVTDAAGAARPAGLIFVSPRQVNYVMPAGTAAGQANVTVRSGDGTVSNGTIAVEPAAPALFSAGADGRGAAAGFALRIRPDGSRSSEPLFRCQPAGGCVPLPFDPGGDQIILELYGTGIRAASAVTARVGGLAADVLFAGPQNQFPGLDQVNLRLPAGLAPGRAHEILVTAEGSTANPVTVQVSSAAAFVRFDPASPEVGPFPTDFLTVFDASQKTGVRVNMPLPDCGAQPSTCQELSAINRLDGFNLQPRLSIQFSGAVDATSLREGIFLSWLDGGLQPAGRLSGINQVIYDPATHTAYAESNDALSQQRRYALVVTDAVRDPAGRSVAADPAFLRCIQSPANTYCSQLAQAVAAVSASVAPRRIVAASMFTTLSATDWMERARRRIQDTPLNVRRTGERSIFDVSDILSATLRLQVGANPSRFEDFTIPLPSLVVGGGVRLAFGSFQSPNFLDARQTIPLTPTGQDIAAPASTQEIFFHVFLPATARPAAGYPVVIFGHGLNDTRFGGPTLVAGSLAREGLATIVINAVGHGSGPQTSFVLRELTRTTELTAGGRGVDLDGDGAIGSREGCLLLSPPTIALRDCLRQTTVDLAQLVRAIRAGLDMDADGVVDLDGSRIYFAGQSLGALYGTLLTAVEPAVRAAVLNVGGASVVDIARWSPGFESLARDALAVRMPPLLNRPGGFNENFVFRDQPVKVNDVPGAIAIQEFFERIEWLQAPGDPGSFAPHLSLAPLAGVPQKRVLFQFARGDRTVPNPANSKLIRLAGLRESSVLYRHDLARAVSGNLAENPHAYLVDVRSPAGIAIALAAQAQLAGFLRTDGAAIPEVNPSLRSLFEIPARLPEDLGF